MPAGYAAAAIGMRGDAEVQKRVGKVLGYCIERILRNEGEMKGDTYAEQNSAGLAE